MTTESLDRQGVADPFRASWEDTRRYAKSFYFASHVLPRQKRMAAYALYAFCRHVDNVIDDAPLQGTAEPAISRIDELREQLGHVYAQSPLMHPRLLAFRETVSGFQIPQGLFLDLLRGVEMDLAIQRYVTFSELEEYCYCVASTVGLMMTRVFGFEDDRALDHARHLGTAMQLTNILRDVEEDYQRGRIYLPAEEMHRFGVTDRHVRDRIVDEHWDQFMTFQIARARRFYAMAEPGIALLTNDGSQYCVRLMSRIYEGILSDIENHGNNVFGYRAHVPLWKKLVIASGALLAPGSSRKYPSLTNDALEDTARAQDQSFISHHLPSSRH